MSKLLFHGTSIYALARIAATDTLLNGVYWDKPGEPNGPRFSESFDVAKTFIEYACHWGEGGVLVLDFDLLERDFKLQEYCDKTYDGDDFELNEHEIAAICEEIPNLSQYLVSIVCDPACIQQAQENENIAMAQQECGWIDAWGHISSNEPKQDHLNAMVFDMNKLLAHPKLNADQRYDFSSVSFGNWDTTSPRILL